MKFNAQYQKGTPEGIPFSTYDGDDFNNTITLKFSGKLHL